VLVLMLICCERKILLNSWLISSSEYMVIAFLHGQLGQAHRMQTSHPSYALQLGLLGSHLLE
jgi:hypothetical protein